MVRLFGSAACDQLVFQNLASVAKGQNVQAYERTSQEAKTPEELKAKLEAYMKAEVAKKTAVFVRHLTRRRV